MDGTAMVDTVRQILKDVSDKTQKGEYWSVEEILLALNAAQYSFVNYCIKNDKRYMIESLLKQTGYRVSGLLPDDYMHYASAQVGPTADSMKIARVYLGGEGEVYHYTSHYAAIIINDTIYFIVNGQDSSGQLFYYYHPSYIGATYNSNNTKPDFSRQDFDTAIYNNIFAVHAAIILGIKEIQTQREYKRSKRLLSKMIIEPPVGVLYPVNNEIPPALLAKMVQYAEAMKKYEG